MAKLDMIRMLVGYHAALGDQLWQSIMQLSDEQFAQEVPYSHGSIRNQMLHMASVDGRWLRGLRGEPDARSFNLLPEGYPTRQQAHAAWHAVADDLKAYIASVDEAALDQPAPGMDEPAWQIIMHLVNHGTDHRAQTLRVLHDVGGPTFGQDFIFYVWQQRES